MIATKKREDGLIKMTVPEDTDVEGKDVFIPDDICDGGWTFKLLAQELKKRGARSIHLHVHHGLFSNGISNLSEIDTFSCHYLKENIITGIDLIPEKMTVTLKHINGKLIGA